MFKSAKDLFVELKETSRAGRIRLLSRKSVRTLEDTVGLEEYHCLVEQPVSSDSQLKLAALLSAVLVSLTDDLDAVGIEKTPELPGLDLDQLR